MDRLKSPDGRGGWMGEKGEGSKMLQNSRRNVNYSAGNIVNKVVKLCMALGEE